MCLFLLLHSVLYFALGVIAAHCFQLLRCWFGLEEGLRNDRLPVSWCSGHSHGLPHLFFGPCRLPWLGVTIRDTTNEMAACFFWNFSSPKYHSVHLLHTFWTCDLNKGCWSAFLGDCFAGPHRRTEELCQLLESSFLSQVSQCWHIGLIVYRCLLVSLAIKVLKNYFVCVRLEGGLWIKNACTLPVLHGNHLIMFNCLKLTQKEGTSLEIRTMGAAKEWKYVDYFNICFSFFLGSVISFH